MNLTILQTALAWYDRGITPIPCRPRSKVPAVTWGRWQERRPPRQLVEHWFEYDRNPALLTESFIGIWKEQKFT